MIRVALLLATLAGAPPSAPASPDPSGAAPAAHDTRRTVEYDLSASLDPETHQVRGAGRVRWTHHGTRPVRSLWWHLYLNAFKNDRTTFMRESDLGRLRGDAFDREHWGWIDVETMQIVHADGARTDVLAAAEFRRPDDGNVHDETVLETPLPFEVAPGETIELEVEFVSQLPKVFARSGFSGSFHFVAQWFPKLGVLQETLTSSTPGAPRWNCHQYHATSEYFADYGAYRVKIDVPEDHVVGATGVRVKSETKDGRAIHEYAIEDVHDFAWTADPRFVAIERKFDAAAIDPADVAKVAAQLGRAPESIALGDVAVRLLIQPEHAMYADRYFEATFAALKWFGLWYGAYPYPVLTVVDGPRGANGAMGMEYPTFITGGVSWPSPDGSGRPEGVTIHEFGHQYWYGLVGSNEFEEAWLDEGLNTYSSGKVEDAAFGPFMRAPRFAGLPLVPWFSSLTTEPMDVARIGTMLGGDVDALVRRSWDYRSDSYYGMNNYPRSALTLRQLEVVLGEDELIRAMRLYQERYRFRHPTTADFVAVLEEVHGTPLDDFARRALFTADYVDYAVDALKSKKRKVAAGVFDEDGERRTVDAEEVEDDEEDVYVTELVLRRETSVDFPVTVEVAFEGGDTRRFEWDGEYRWKRFEIETSSRAVSARLHPDGEQRLDLRRANDSRRVEKSHRAAATWGATALYLVQTLWQVLGGLL